MSEAAIGWGELLAHLSRSAALCRGVLGRHVMTTGSGPVDEGDFDKFLAACKISVEDVSENGPDVLVIGHDDWDEDDLDAAIRVRKGGTLRIYSQEMVFASLALGADIFDILSADELAAFGVGHPALEYLSQDIGFDWPTTDVVVNSNRLVVDFGNGEWPETGILRKMGYTVGRQGLVASARQEVLKKVLSVKLIAGSDGADWYIEQWGPPMSAQRLHKMANCIAAFAQSKKRVRNYDYSEAIADWESDLEWLMITYYKPSLGFRWPDTKVRAQ